jgi:hypothetical protein
MTESLKRAIYFYDEAGQSCVMNYSSIGESGRRDGTPSVYEFLCAQHGITTEAGKRRAPDGTAIHISIVRDRAALKTAARAAGIEIANEWPGWN